MPQRIHAQPMMERKVHHSPLVVPFPPTSESWQFESAKVRPLEPSEKKKMKIYEKLISLQIIG